MNHIVYVYALTATLCFSSSSLVFTEFANRTHALWVNKFKALIAAIFSALTISFFLGWHQITLLSLVLLLVSGFIGLNVGDFFMIKAFQSIGPSRTLLLYGFQPLMVGIASYYCFGQTINPHKLIAIIFLVGCLFTFSYERFKERGHWEILGFILALIFICLDSTGLILTRLAFNNSPQIGALEAHCYRSLGAVIGFWFIMPFRPIYFIKTYMNMTTKARMAIFLGAFFGTFLSLAFFFKAVQTGHLATVTSISITSPFFAALFESIYHKKKPSKYLVMAFTQFVIGFWILIQF